MKVVLLKDADIGDRGNIIEVKAGFARNFLFPEGIALEANKGNRKHVEIITLQQKKKLEKEKTDVRKLADKLNAMPEKVFKVKGSEDGKLFGSVTNIQIADELSQELGITISHRKVGIRNIKEVGLVEVPIKFTFGIIGQAKIKVELEVVKQKEEQRGLKKKARKSKKDDASTSSAQDEDTLEETPAGPEPSQGASPVDTEKVEEAKPEKKSEET